MNIKGTLKFIFIWFIFWTLLMMVTYGPISLCLGKSWELYWLFSFLTGTLNWFIWYEWAPKLKEKLSA